MLVTPMRRTDCDLPDAFPRFHPAIQPSAHHAPRLYRAPLLGVFAISVCSQQTALPTRTRHGTGAGCGIAESMHLVFGAGSSRRGQTASHRYLYSIPIACRVRSDSATAH